MLLAVVVCPHCRRVQVVETRVTRPGCRACQRSFELAGRKSFYSGEDPEEARRVASRIALQVAGAGIEALAESAAAVERERAGSLEDVVASLSRREEFVLDDVRHELERHRVTGSAERVVELLRRENRVFEPRPGRFRWVG